MSALLGGPLHGHEQVFGFLPHGYELQPGADDVWRFVHLGVAEAPSSELEYLKFQAGLLLRRLVADGVIGEDSIYRRLTEHVLQICAQST